MVICLTTLTEVFPYFFFSCKANSRVKPAKTGHGPHSSQLLCCSMYFLCCSMCCLFCDVPCIVCVYMCTEQLPPGGYPIAVKYIILYVLVFYFTTIRPSYRNLRYLQVLPLVRIYKYTLKVKFICRKNQEFVCFLLGNSQAYNFICRRFGTLCSVFIGGQVQNDYV